MKAASARRAEKALKEILDKADDNANGRVRLKDFIDILDSNGVEVTEWFHSLAQMDDGELEGFSSLVDSSGEISKHDLIVQTKKSSFWKGNLDLKTKPCAHSTKVRFHVRCVE